MKILLVHNFYQSSSPSGEDSVFKNELGLLEKSNINVITYTKHNDKILKYRILNKIKLPFKNIWSLETYREIQSLIKREKPDVAHFHNIWYLISPSAYYACKDMGVAVVQTLHNFRIFCTNGLLLRDENICEECITKTSNKFRVIKNALKYKCYKKSRLYSLSVAFTEYIHWINETWINKVDEYIALTKFSKNKFIEAGLPSSKIYVKPNFLLNPPRPNYSHKNYALFIGRLSYEKGINILIDSIKYLNFLFKRINFKIKIIGDGPLKAYMENLILVSDIKNIEFLGLKNNNECIELLKDAKFLILPSICYEVFPMVVIEAFACGKPVIASNLGALAELIEDGRTGLLFEPRNPIDLAKKINFMIENEDLYVQMCKNAREEFETKYTAERNFEILMQIYNNVI
jgi:glycosyltransferase involved in cell wall biosynthesis